MCSQEDARESSTMPSPITEQLDQIRSYHNYQFPDPAGAERKSTRMRKGRHCRGCMHMMRHLTFSITMRSAGGLPDLIHDSL